MNSVPCWQKCQEGKGWGLFNLFTQGRGCRAKPPPWPGAPSCPCSGEGRRFVASESPISLGSRGDGSRGVPQRMDGPGEVPGEVPAAYADKAAPAHGAGHKQPV